MSGKYVKNNEIQEAAKLTSEFIKKCTFNVGATIPVRTGNDNSSSQSTDRPSKQFFNKYISVTYPGGEQSSSMLIPGAVMHHSTFDYYGKPSVYVGIPQSIVRELTLKLSNVGEHPKFEDRKIMSNASYFWTKASLQPADEGREFIRTCDDDGIEYYESFEQFFAAFPTSVTMNLTTSMKLQTDTPVGEQPNEKSVWRVTLTPAMFTPTDAIEVDAPSTGVSQKSTAGQGDTMRKGLASKRVTG